MFRKIAHYLTTHTLIRHLCFLGLAILAIAVNGYHFGTFDQVFHIPFLKKFVNPGLYPNDPFLTLRWYHFSFFWFPFIPLYRAGLLEISMFIVHIATVYGTIWMFWALTETLFKNEVANLLIVLALIFPHLGFPGFQIIEFSLLNRTFVLPFLLGSILLYLKDKKILAFMLLGLMFNLHVIYAAFVLCMFLLNELLQFKLRDWWKPLVRFAVFVIMALPVLIWRMRTGNGVDFTLRPEMLDLASRGLLFTVYYPISNVPYVIGNLVAGIGTVWAFILGYRRAPKSNQQRTIRNFVFAIGIVTIVGILTSYLLPITIIIQLQILRIGVFMLYFGMIYLAYFISDQFTQGELHRQGFLLIGLTFILIITPLVSILVWYLTRWLVKTRFKPAWLVPVVVAVQAVTIFIGIKSDLWSPGFQIYGPQSAWRDVQEWAKWNTNLDAMFISPPNMFWHYVPDWRVFSERSTVVTVPEIMEIPFDPAFEESFKSRFMMVAPGAIQQFTGDYMKTIAITKQAFYTNQAADFIQIGCRYDADYLVVDSDHPYDFELIYQNEGFLVYHLPDCE